MIGSGATTVHVARRMASELRDITVITHAFGVATVLSMNLNHPGDRRSRGVLRYRRGNDRCGTSLQFLSQFTADYTLLGASGIAADGEPGVNRQWNGLPGDDPARREEHCRRRPLEVRPHLSLPLRGLVGHQPFNY